MTEQIHGSSETSNGTFPTDAHSAVRVYLARGLAPIPLPPRSKEPGLADWTNLRLNAETLDKHFPPQEIRNVGILNGQPSANILDVDLDCREAVVAAPLLLPKTGWVFGCPSAIASHRIFRTDRSLDTAQEKYVDLDGTVLVELRGTGGMTVYPPSTHKETGEQIFWEAFTDPGAVTLTGLQRAVREVAAVSLLARHWPCQGSRQTAFLALAGGLLRAEWRLERIERFIEALATVTHDEEIKKRIQVVAQTTGKLEQDRKATGWPKLDELLGPNGKALVQRVCQWLQQAATPRSWNEFVPLGDVPEVPTFPEEVFPEAAQCVVREIAVALPCPVDFVTTPLLVMAGGAIGASRALAIKEGHIQRACIYAAVIGPPGSDKSPAQEKVVETVHELEESLHASWEETMEQFQDDQEIYESEMREWKKKGGDLPKKPKRPILERLTVNDATSESLVPILKENPRGVVLVRDELIGWVQAMNQYREGGKGADQQFWLSAWSGSTVTVDRRKTHELGPLRVRHPFISVIGGLTPDKLSALRGDKPRQKVKQDGFIDRLLMSFPSEPHVTAENWMEVESATLEKLSGLIGKLRSLEMVPIQEGDKVKGWRPFIVKLTSTGRQEWQRFTQQHANERNEDDFPPQLIGPWSKLRGYTGRLALILHFLRWAAGEVKDQDVDGESMERAARLVAYFKAHIRKVYAVMDADPKATSAQRLLKWIIQENRQQFTRRDSYRAMRGTCKTVDDIDPILTLLEKHGYIRPLPTSDDGRSGRKASPGFETNPLFLGQNGHNGQNPTERPPEPPSEGNCVHSVHSVQTKEAGASSIAIPAETKSSDEVENPNRGQNGQIGQNGRSDSALQFHMVVDGPGLEMVKIALGDASLVGMDLETTGLNPRKDRVRLLSLSLDTIDGGVFTYLIDCFAVDPSPLWDSLVDKDLVIHNAEFDLSFLARMGFTPAGKVSDTMLLAQLLTAGTHDSNTLAACCNRYLGRLLDKTKQKSNWSDELTPDQLTYAAADSQVLVPLCKVLTAKIKEAKLNEAAEIEHRFLPAIIWLGQNGVFLDKSAWQSLARDAEEHAEGTRQQLDQAAPSRPGRLDGCGSWNWDSPQQAQEALGLLGCKVESTADNVLADTDHPFAQLLRRHRDASKRTSTYGAGWLDHVADDSRVYPRWRQIGAASGRMSCSDPNMQQLPRGDYRRCIVAPNGLVLVKADYSQIELRIAAKVSGDEALLEAYQRGEDLHTITARNVLGIENVTKQDRQLAKALNFGLLYGMGARGFRLYAKSQYGLELTEKEARSYRDSFFKSYPGLASWHRRVRSRQTKETRTLTGRRRLLDSKTPDTQRLNTPVQGTGADGLKLALALLWERRDQAPGASPVLAVHDEIVVEADADQADATATWVKTAMIDAMANKLAPVPVEVEVQISQTWGGY